MGKTKSKGGGGGGGGKISSVKRNNKNVTKLERQGKLNRKAGKRAGGGGGSGKKKSPLDKKVARQKESEKAHRAAIKAKRQEEEEAAADHRDEDEEDEQSEGSENDQVSAKDLKDFGNSSFSLLTGDLSKAVDDSRRRGKKRRKEDDDDEDEQIQAFEKTPRSYGSATEDDGSKKRLLLPIKDKQNRLIQRVGERVAVDEEEEEEEIEEVEETEAPKGFEDDEGFESGTASSSAPVEAPPPRMTAHEAIEWRKRQIAKRKQKIALLCTSIVERPEERMGKLKDLRMMMNADDGDPRLGFTVKKFVMLSMLEIFKDVIPSYRIRALTEQEKSQRMKKETLALVDFEEGLLKNYRLYLVALENLIKNGLTNRKAKPKQTDGGIEGEDEEDDDDAEEEEKRLRMRNSAFLAVKCMSELLVTHPHFNYRTNIVTVLVPLMGSLDEEIGIFVCDAIQRVFKGDKLGDVSYEVVKTLASELKARGHGWPRRTLDVCLSLRIRHDLAEKQKEKSEERKNRYDAYKKLMKYASRKEKKRKKKMTELENQLKATEATPNTDACLEWHTKIMTQLFAIYFRILKKGRDSPLLGSTLAGLSTFAHLINLDFFDDLLSNLHSIIATHRGLTFENTLHCVHTTFAILSGQGSALNIDPMRFYGQMYKDLLVEMANVLGDKSSITPLFLKCIHKMLIARSKQVSQPRLLAFAKRLATLSLHQDHPSSLSFLTALRKLLLLTPKTEILYENEGLGSGAFLPEMEDPEYCKPEATALWELHLAKRHYHPVVASVATKILANHPLQPEHKLTPEISLKDPADLFLLYSGLKPGDSEDGVNDNSSSSDFRPSLVSLSRTKIQTALRKSKKGRNAIFRTHRFADAEFGARLHAICEETGGDDDGDDNEGDISHGHPTDVLTDIEMKEGDDEEEETEPAMIVEC